MKKFLLASAFALVPGLAWGQGAVLQNGSVIKFDLPGWVQDKTIMSGGKMFTDNFRGFNAAHFFDNHGAGVCSEDALTNGPYHQICIGHDVNGLATVTVTANNGAAQQGVSFNVNGTIYQFPFAIGGIVGPNPTVAGNAMLWNNTVGTLAKDAGAPPQLSVPDNAALQALSAVAVGTTVTRQDFGGGAGFPTSYKLSNSACSLNSGVGDGGSQVPRTVDGKCWLAIFANNYDVRIWGADPTGSADATGAIQSAFNACQVGLGGVVNLPAGNFKVAGQINAAGVYWCKLQGVGPGNANGGTGGSRLVASVAVSNVLSMTSNGGAAIDGVAFDSSVTRTGGDFLTLFNNSNNNLIHDVSFSNYYSGINLEWNNGTVDHALFYHPVATNGIGITVSHNAGCDILNDIQMYPPGSGVQPAYGILVNDSACLTISNSDIIQQGTDLALISSTGHSIASTTVSNTFLDTAGTGFLAVGTGVGDIIRTRFVNSWTSSHTNSGINIFNNGTGQVTGFTFDNHEAIVNGLTAINFGGGTGVVRDVNVANSLIGGNGGAGITVAGIGFSANGNRIGAYGGTGANTGLGIVVAVGSSDCIINANHLIGNSSATDPIADGSGTCQRKVNTPLTANN